MQTLHLIKLFANGSIKAIHHWQTGWQILTFPNRKSFDIRQREIHDLD